MSHRWRLKNVPASAGFAALALLLMLFGLQSRAEDHHLPDTEPLVAQGDLAAEMVQRIDRYLLRHTAAVASARDQCWQRDIASHDAYVASIEPNRQRFRRIIGATNLRRGLGQPQGFQPDATFPALTSPSDGTAPSCRIEWVRWPVHYTGGAWSTEGEGLLLTPLDVEIRADVIALPDADTRPSAFVPLAKPGRAAGVPLRLAQSGCRVLVPMLIDRSDEHSLVAQQRRTNQPHREFIYRQAYQMGTHLIGYEVEKVQSAIDCLRLGQHHQQAARPLGVFGDAEGGLVAFYAAAIDTRIDAVGVSSYFGPRAGLWQEPIYRNVWSLLNEFGDAEIASLIAPRSIIIEAAAVPDVAGPPVARDGKQGAAPGRLQTPSLDAILDEAKRAEQLTAGLVPAAVIRVIASNAGPEPADCDEALQAFLHALIPGAELAPSADWPQVLHETDEHQRHFRQFQQLVEYTQHLLRESEYRRREFWQNADRSSLDAWAESTRWYRDYFAQQVIGQLAEPRVPLRPRSRLIYDEPAYRGYEVMLDVFDEVFAYGILLVPKNAGGPLPVVVCQHGLEGRPSDVADADHDHPAYHSYACRLAELGFVTFAPQNPYIGGDKFRTLQRKANPLQLSLFSIITVQHEAILDWLSQQPFVDADRIAFYGLSYGGKTAMRVPALLDRYCLSICSADFNEWIKKNVSVRDKYSYLGTGEYEMPEFNLGNTFNYAEMAALIAPRPFMVERGHHDGVAPDEWVAYEYAKVRQLYAELGVSDRTAIEFFDGPHTIHGVGTFEFLTRQLRNPHGSR